MDNKKETKQFNKKLLVIFFVMLAIFATLLGSKVQAEPAEMQSTQQTSRPNTTYLTYNDLMDYYDILCCQHGTALPSPNQGILTGSIGDRSFSYDMSMWQNTGYDVGSKIENYKITDKGATVTGGTQFTIKTLGYYSIVEKHIGTPKEAYIIAEMKKESSGGQIVDVSGDPIYKDNQGNIYSGSLVDAISVQLPSGEIAYTVNQTYVLDTGNGVYYVKAAKDSNGNVYYVYDTDGKGNLIKYCDSHNGENGETEIYCLDQETGESTPCLGREQSNIYYEFNGELKSGNTVATDHGILYLLSYDIVKQDGENLVYTYIANENNYIQMAWWTTAAGSEGIGVAPNSLSTEADLFQNYILKVAGVNEVGQLEYEVQSYDFYEADGTHSVGSVKAPVISYKAGFNEDADQNGEINEADEITPSFDSNTQKYIVGPFSLNYIKESAHVAGRAKVDFAGIKDVKLVSNLGELKLGTDWNFKFLTDQARDLDEDYPYPNPNEVFYIEIKYMEDLTSIENFEFSFKYMNAGAELDKYDGNYNEVTWTVETAEYMKDQTVFDYYKTDKYGNYLRDDYGNRIPVYKTIKVFDYQDVWLECTSVVPNDAQTLAHALIGARWYNETNCNKKFGLNSGTITIEKRTLTEDGLEVIPVDKEYQFKIFINGKEFQELTIKTENGYGKATSIPYVWTDEDKVPTYEVVELGDNKNNGPWTGTLENHKTVTVIGENYIGPNKGKLEVDKKLLNPTPALEDETFTFKVSVTGKFGYGDGKIISYSSKNPLQIEFTIKGAGIWTSEDFRWYGDAPKYKVEEIIDENATYELVNGVVSNGVGQLKKDETVVATATNQPTTSYTDIYVDKRMVSSTKPEKGEVFEATLKIDGNFSYNGDEIKSRTETFTIVLDENNNWQWKSDRIVWNKDEVPTYTISETKMAEGTTFVSISDEVLSNTVNNFSSKLNPEKTHIVITNSRENPLIGKLKIQKMAETKDLAGKTFRFRVKIEDTNTSDLGGFKYQDVIDLTANSKNYTKSEENGLITVNPEGNIEFYVDIKLPELNSSDEVPVGEWKSQAITWSKDADAPKYEVEEVGMVKEDGTVTNEGFEFVSISNSDKKVTSSRTISGNLEGKELLQTTADINNVPAGQVVVSCVNRNVAEKFGHIVIDKEAFEDDSIDGTNFEFKVTITGVFKYWDKVGEDNKPTYTSYGSNGQPASLVLNGVTDGVTAVCGGEDWISEMISWDEGVEAPTYTVEEINIPEDCEFVSIQEGANGTPIKTPKISGTIRENNDFIYIIATNKPGDDYEGHSLKIEKRLEGETDYKKFHFDLTVEGEFEYNGVSYGKNSENGNKYTLEDIELDFTNINSDEKVLSWYSGKFTWKKGADAPKYTVKETDKPVNEDNYETEPEVDENGIAKGFRFISIGAENVSKKCTDPKDRSITGYLDSDRMIEIKAINRGELEEGGHIQITKKVLNSDLKNTPFYFNVEVTSDEAFIYHDKDDGTDGTKYDVDPSTGKATMKIEHVVAYADGLDWFSEYVEWNLDNKPKGEYAIPQYKISEITGEFPNGVESVSIENDTEKITKKLDNKSEEDLTITGQMIGDVTQIIAINDKPTELKGKLYIQKLVESAPKDFTSGNFTFEITVDGKFKYDGKEYNGEKLTFTQTITVNKDENTGVIKGDWESEDFIWDESDGNPEYTVKEINLPSDWKFVSISNGTTTETETKTISGTLNGEINEGENSSSGRVVITCKNKKGDIKEGELVIVKKSENDALDGAIFNFNVTITGVFKYYDQPDHTYRQIGYINENGEQVKDTIELNASVVCGGDDWVSSIMTWDEDVDEPTYTVEEVNLPEGTRFVSLENDEQGTVFTQKISGTIDEGRQFNYVIAINDGDGSDDENASIRITKMLEGKTENKTFKFEVKIDGDFYYQNQHYTDGLTIDNVEITVDEELGIGTWVSGKVIWDQGKDAPTYTVKETDQGSADFVSISDEKTICTDPNVRLVTGSLDSDRTVRVKAINRGDTPTGGRIEITKEVINKALKGTIFYFDVTVESDYNFTYRPENDSFNAVTYGKDNPFVAKNVEVEADGKDWISGYFEWEEGQAPHYTVTELHAKFPSGVESVYISDDNELHPKTLTNQTTDDTLTVDGDMIGANDSDGNGVGVHVWAKNDYPEDLKGNLTIEKKALSPLIEGEEFIFTVTINGTFKYNGKQYTDETLKIENISITANGPSWKSADIEWSKNGSAPTYTVTEETATFANGVEFVTIKNAYQSNNQPMIEGTIEEGDNWVIAENTLTNENEKGRLQIHKVLLDEKGNEIPGLTFEFKVDVTFYDKDGNVRDTQSDTIDVVSGEYWRSGWYNWTEGEKAPTYHIEETENSGYKVEIDKPDGELVAQDTESGENGITFVNATNHYTDQYKAKIKVNKKLILNDKMSEDDVTVSFKALVKVMGQFTYKGVAYGDGDNNGTLSLEVTLNKDSNWTWTSDEINWVEGAPNPTFTVEETEIPDGWHLVGTEVTPDDNTLRDGETAVVDITNEWRYDEELILTMEIGGKVWDDTNRTVDKHIDALENGIIDEGEAGVPNVKVTVYRALMDKTTGQFVRRLDGVYAYDENDLSVRIDPVTYTDENGNWSFEAISVPALVGVEEQTLYKDGYCVTYDVEFEYDGQTYEPTEFLATAGGNTASYVGADSSNNMYSDVKDRWATVINSSTSERDKYLDNSMAIDDKEARTEFNNSFADIQGESPMDDFGNTVGTTGSGKELNYSSVDSASFFNSDNSRKVSTLETIDENGEIYEDLRIPAATSNADLTFPFYNVDPNYDTTAWHLRSWDKTMTDVFKITYKFEAVYNYCLSINLGLVEREATDLAVEKDLTEALVVVNGKAIKYKFNSAIDLEDPDYTELLYKQLAVANSEIEYKLGLYKGDYYYRADIYDGNVEDALTNFYKNKLNLPLESSEMEIYLKYTINVYNQSETYDVVVGEIADYYDSTFKLITEPENRYVQTMNGEEVAEATTMEVARPSTVSYSNDETEEITWVDAGTSDGSDGIGYTKITTSSLAGRKLASGEKASITVTFKVDKDNRNESGVLNAIKLGEKHNVAEVTKFTSYYSNSSENRWSEPGQISGRVDEDSAPDNVNITYYNEKSYYEDDTESAPIITIGLSDENRAISGIVWDDAQTADAGLGQTVGDGLYDPSQGDKLISGITTEIYESITVPKSSGEGYEEYQFAWPTDKEMDVLGGQSLSQLTGFNQAVETDKNGTYSFINMPAGNYKVRYVYGDKKIETGNVGSEEVYNGQDYKTTAYQIGFDNDRNDDGYVDNEWHDINNDKLNKLRVNDARDDEARRLYISAKSEMLTYDNTSLLSKADRSIEDHKDLFGNYGDAKNSDPVIGDGFYMYAETAKINLGVENIYDINYTTEDNMASVDGKATENGQDVGTSMFKYNVRNVDCGIEERSQTKLTLDKQIKQITLMTSDNKVILDAVYDINYTLKSDGTISASVTLNESKSTNSDHLASLNRSGKDQGYRYLIADSQILQGTTIQVKYQLTVFNMSETDRISSKLDELWAKLDLTNVSDEDMFNAMSNSEFTEALERVSTHEYTANDGRVFNGEPVGYGTYFGSVYYLGKQGVGVRPDETIVKTKVHQMIDYVDPDVEFTDMNNISKDQSWSNTDIEYLVNNHLIDTDMIKIVNKETGEVEGTYELGQAINDEKQRYSIISDKFQEYKTDSKNNLIINMDNGENQDTGSNPGFVKFLEPYMAEKNVDRCTGTISLTVSRFYSSETDANDIDNLAEIIKVENTAGRRDARNIAGNANPCELDGENPIGIYAVSVQGKERDASATEVITLSPPTGLSPEESRTMQLIIVVLISITLVAVSIVVIKKKVLPKN